jgi:HlyD family secretion protein
MKYLLPVFYVSNALAGELIVEPKPFAVTQTLTGTVFPTDVVPLRVDAKSWTTFQILTIAEHGVAVKKGEVLVAFDAIEIDKKLADTKYAIATDELGLEQAKLELATFEKTMPDELAKVERAAKDAAEELDYFTKTRRKASEESAKYSLMYKEQQLASTKEELKQLLKMYEADDVTEETEEIILANQRAEVEFAEFGLRMEELDYKRAMEVTLPKEAISLTESRDKSALDLEAASKDMPRALQLKKLEVAEKETGLARWRELLADLEKDRGLFEIKADSDGVFYYGAMEQGRWEGGDYAKELVVKGSAPTGKVFASFIPSTANLVVYSFPKQAEALALAVGKEGIARLAGREELAIPVKVSSIGQSPLLDGTYEMELAATWPKEMKPVVGQELAIKLVSYAKADALAVPVKSLDFGASGWSVEVKLTDGKTERRAVTLGRSTGELTEIVSGLEAGQVVIVP